AKLQATRLAVDVTRRAVQMEGGFGYSKESKAEMFYRDSKILEIGEGTNEVMKYVIYKLLEKKFG
ncbi:MAG: acyl-CoA dehydrogenase family protein, partial [Thermoproteus sp.]